MADISREPGSEATTSMGERARRRSGREPGDGAGADQGASAAGPGTRLGGSWPAIVPLDEAVEAARMAGEDVAPLRSDEAGQGAHAESGDSAAEQDGGVLDPSRDGREDREAADPIEDAARLARVVFGLLLASREPLTVLRLAQVCGTSQAAVQQALADLAGRCAGAGLPLEIAQHGGTVRALTAPDVFPYLQALKGVQKADKLSMAALETLAVIAYRQPVFRAEIEAIRGVKVGPTLRTLLDHKLVKVVGRADVPGRPLQYGTSQEFLDRFGLRSLDELPSVKELKGLG
jgi:segregation and condensation protein B